MALRRSNTAPQSFGGHDKKGVVLTRSRTTHSDLDYLPSSSSWRSPARPHERQDAFNLGGFFPSARLGGTSGEGEQWEWLRQEEAGGALMVDEEDDPLPPTPGGATAFARLHADVAEEAIEGEDKMGVLSLTAFLNRYERGGEERLYSPYSDGDVMDHDSLYLALCKRRDVYAVEDDVDLLSSSWTTLLQRMAGLVL